MDQSTDMEGVSRTDNSDGADRFPSNKRPRLLDINEDAHLNDRQHATATAQCSVHEFLSVPLQIIFRRQEGGGRRRHKPLMTRAEAHTFLTITELARELDVLVNLSSQALERKIQSRIITARIQDIPTFRSLVPSLVVHGQYIPEQALSHLQLELDRVLASFQASALTLKQFSEQNWTMSESLLDAFGPDDQRGQVLAQEKQGLSDLQEELSKRLEHLSSVSKEAIFDDYNQGALSMATLANGIFGVKDTPTASKRPPHKRSKLQIARKSTAVAIADKPTIKNMSEEEKSQGETHTQLAARKPSPKLNRKRPPLGVKRPGQPTRPSASSVEDLIASAANTAMEVVEENDDDDDDDPAVIQASPNRVEVAETLTKFHVESRNDSRRQIPEDDDDDDDDEEAFERRDELDNETQALPESLANTQTAVEALSSLTNV